MVAQVLRLKLILLANSFRRTPWQVVGVILGLAYGVASAMFLAAGLVALRFFEVDIARNAVVVFGSIAVIVFAVLPLLLGIEDFLDPRRFALYGMSNTRLSMSIAAASLIGVPAIVITIIAVGQVSTWSRGLIPFQYSVVSAVLIVLTCVLLARISTTLGAFLLSTRRSRDFTTLISIVLLISLIPLAIYLTSVNWITDGETLLSQIAGVVGWTPLGAAWAAPADAAAGDTGSAFGKIMLAIAWLVALIFIWRHLVGAVLVRPQRQAQAKKYTGLGWFDRLPGNPTGAIAARSLTYWTRDVRYLTSLAIIPIIPVVMVFALAIAGVPLNLLALLPLPVMCLFLSWSVHNDVAFDNTAIWLHLVSSTSGVADRVGRLVPAFTLGTPLILIGATISAWLYGDWDVLPSLIGVCSAILLVGLGLSSVMSARFPYPAVRPGDSPFSQPQAGGNAAGLIQAMSFFGILLFASPAIASALLGIIYGEQWRFASLGSGLGVGILALIIGVRVGARSFEKRGPEILAAALKN